MLSIALCTYNGVRFLREQLDSLVQQSLQANEIIVCDDCSTDNTLEILREYTCKLPLKITVNSKNLGYTQNFSQAVSLCSGEYVALCDQDDIWRKDKIRKLYTELINGEQLHGADTPLMVYSDRQLVNEYGDIVCQSSAKKTGLRYTENNFLKALFFGNPAAGCTMLFNRALLNVAGTVPKGVKSHDWWYILVAAAVGRVGYVSEPQINYRLHGNNAEGLGVALSLTNITKQLSFEHNDSYMAYKIFQVRALQNRLKILGISNSVVNEFCDIFSDGGIASGKQLSQLIRRGYLPQGWKRQLLFVLTVLRGKFVVRQK